MVGRAPDLSDFSGASGITLPQILLMQRHHPSAKYVDAGTAIRGSSQSEVHRSAVPPRSHLRDSHFWGTLLSNEPARRRTAHPTVERTSFPKPVWFNPIPRRFGLGWSGGASDHGA
jgi:hypothetical protein